MASAHFGCQKIHKKKIILDVFWSHDDSAIDSLRRICRITKAKPNMGLLYDIQTSGQSKLTDNFTANGK
jgi:hypothetical protein